jgi:hypothetical protein
MQMRVLRHSARRPLDRAGRAPAPGHVRLWDGVQAGEPVAALRDQWFRLLPLVKIIFDPAWRDDRGAPHWLELMHAAADILGQDVGLPRAPFAALAGADRDRLAGILSAISATA